MTYITYAFPDSKMYAKLLYNYYSSQWVANFGLAFNINPDIWSMIFGNYKTNQLVITFVQNGQKGDRKC